MEVVGFAAGGNIRDYLGRESGSKSTVEGRGWCQVAAGVSGALGEEIKKPLWLHGLGRLSSRDGWGGKCSWVVT